MTPRTDAFKGFILALTGALALSPDGLLVRLVDADNVTALFWRGFLIFLILFIYQAGLYKTAVFKEFFPKTKIELLAGILAGLGTAAFMLSIQHTTVANTLVILSTMSLFAALFSMVFLKERFGIRTWTAIIFAIVGIVIVFAENLSGGTLTGNLIALLCAIITASFLTLIRANPQLNVCALVGCGGLYISVPTFFMAASLSLDPASGAAVLAMCLLNAYAHVALGMAGKYIPAPEVTLMMLLETVIGPVWVWAIISETPSPNALIGGAIVITTLSLHSLSKLKERMRKPS